MAETITMSVISRDKDKLRHSVSTNMMQTCVQTLLSYAFFPLGKVRAIRELGIFPTRSCLMSAPGEAPCGHAMYSKGSPLKRSVCSEVGWLNGRAHTFFFRLLPGPQKANSDSPNRAQKCNYIVDSRRNF